jgi:metal-sulfur cluster biosynthetic enzyme
MDTGQTQLRDRMLRDAIMEVLRSPFDPAGQGADISLVDAGLIGHVAVAEDRVRVELPLPGEWSPFVGPLVAEVQRRVQALPEVTVTEITVTSTQPGVAPPEDHHGLEEPAGKAIVLTEGPAPG